MRPSEHLETAATPFASSVLDGPFDGVARVEGTFPDWLRGRLVRTAPAIFEQDGWRANHWFDALGMLYSFEIETSNRVSWMQRLLDSEVSRAAQRGRAPYAMFGTPIRRSMLRQLVEPIPVSTDNANVNIVPMGSDWVAMTETNRQLSIDPETLATRGHVVYEDGLPGGMWMTAHPHFDVDRNVAVNVGTIVGARSELVVYEHTPGVRRRTVVGRVPMRRLPYVHSFGLTRSSAVLIAHPFDVSPLSLLWSNRFVEHYRWRPEQGTRLHVVDRATGASRTVEAEPMFVFHTVNTFEQGDDLILDVLAYRDPEVVRRHMRIEGLRQGVPGLLPQLTRLRIRPGRQRADVEQLVDGGFEFPSIHYRRQSGRPHRFVWGAAIAPARGDAGGMGIVRVDVERGERQSFAGGSFTLGEPIFVPRPGGTAEDDGVLLSVGADNAAKSAKLIALDARSLEPIAEATIPVPLPLGFHGSFQRSAR